MVRENLEHWSTSRADQVPVAMLIRRQKWQCPLSQSGWCVGRPKDSWTTEECWLLGEAWKKLKYIHRIKFPILSFHREIDLPWVCLGAFHLVGHCLSEVHGFTSLCDYIAKGIANERIVFPCLYNEMLIFWFIHHKMKLGGWCSTSWTIVTEY